MSDHHHHQKIHLILNTLNVDLFEEVGAYFGGGTLITLLNNEYRWSKDVDFICPVGAGYRRLRKIVADANFKASVFFSDTNRLSLPRDLIDLGVLRHQGPLPQEAIAKQKKKGGRDMQNPFYTVDNKLGF